MDGNGASWHRTAGLDGLAQAAFPVRELELATYLSRLHGTTTHHLSPSECETMRLGALLALADADGRERWDALTLGYTEPAGAAWLREDIARTYPTLAADQIISFAGAQEALYAAVHALISPGDHAIVVLPGYQSMESLLLGCCEVSGVALDPNAGWSLDLDRVAAAVRPNTRVLVISFPNNPTGKHLDAASYAAVTALCRRRGIWLLSDEVYRLTERDPAHRLLQAAEAYERGISLGAMSKAYGLPGLRLGWVACRDATLVARLATMRQYLSTCNAGPVEVLASIALRAAPAILSRNRAITDANLALLLSFLCRHQSLFECHPPEGGMVCYPRYKGAEGVERFVVRAAAEASVLLLPSSVFRSELLPLTTDRLRIGFGRTGFAAGLEALDAFLGRL